MRPGQKNLITDVPGLKVGNAQDDQLKSGSTVLLADRPFVASVHVMGGAPGTRETDLLAPDKAVPAVDALVMSGGSAFGLAAADGVVAGLRADNRGFEANGHLVPIVPGAIIFDLASGGEKVWTDSPYPALGRAAYDARGASVALGSEGAGTGAMTADLKGGVGSASAVLPSGGNVGALVVVNALGQVTHGRTGQFWAAAFEQGDEFGGLGASTDAAGPVVTKRNRDGATTIAIVATDVILTKAEAHRVAVAAHDGLARAVVPAHTPFDGDLVFAASTGLRPPEGDDLFLLGHAAATCLARAIARGVFAARATGDDPVPTWGERFGHAK